MRRSGIYMTHGSSRKLVGEKLSCNNTEFIGWVKNDEVLSYESMDDFLAKIKALPARTITAEELSPSK